jgi:hypothetical protein
MLCSSREFAGKEWPLGRWMHTQYKRKRMGKIVGARADMFHRLVDAGKFKWPKPHTNSNAASFETPESTPVSTTASSTTAVSYGSKSKRKSKSKRRGGSASVSSGGNSASSSRKRQRSTSATPSPTSIHPSTLSSVNPALSDYSIASLATSLVPDLSEDASDIVIVHPYGSRRTRSKEACEVPTGPKPSESYDPSPGTGIQLLYAAAFQNVSYEHSN